MAKRNWAAIASDFIETVEARPTLDELADTLGVSRSHLRRIAGRERWLERSRLFDAVTAQKRADRKSTLLAGTQSEWDATCLHLARALLQLVAKSTKELQQQNPIPLGRLEAVVRTLARAQAIGRLALGEADPSVKGV